MSFKRKPGRELLDSDEGTPEEIRSALRSISFVNRWFGGNRVHRLLLEQAAEGRRELQVLEVAAGFARPLAAAALSLQRRGTTVHAALLDLNSTHLPPSWPASLPAPRLLQGDATAIPLPDKSMDVVSCCLFIHHLAPEQVARFLHEAVRVARVAVLVNDLRRTRTHYLLARLLSLVDPSRISRHDGPTSVRQTYSLQEVRAMLHGLGCPFTLRRRFLYRFAASIRVS